MYVSNKKMEFLPEILRKSLFNERYPNPSAFTVMRASHASVFVGPLFLAPHGQQVVQDYLLTWHHSVGKVATSTC